MFYYKLLFSFFFCCLILVKGENHELPSWITENPAFQQPTTIDAIKKGAGSISCTGAKASSWIIHLNDKLGYGVEIELKKLALSPNHDDYLMIAAWPISTNKFKEIKLYTGQFKRSFKLRIPNTKSVFVMYKATDISSPPQMDLTFKRYGSSFEQNPPATESPIKKGIIYDVQLKGKPPSDYSNEDFMNKVKEAIRAMAKNYCSRKNIPFKDKTPTNEMVLIHKVFFCPLEWPDRDICVSLQHAVFVSGTKNADDVILNYELTTDHLQDMWLSMDAPELKALGVTVFRIPVASKVMLWWTLFSCAAIFASLLAISVFWGVQKYTKETRFRTSSDFSDVVLRRKIPKLKLPKHQKIPPFMYGGGLERKKVEEQVLKSTITEIHPTDKFEDVPLERPAPSPIKNYFGGFLFGSNRAFEDDEETVAEFRPKSQKL